jgi:hypothetical protein
MATTPTPMTNVYTGATGFLVLQPDNTNAPEGADANTVLTQANYGLGNNAQVGRVTGVEIHVNTDLQGYYEVGRRHPVSLHPENIHISGKINRAYINGALLFLLLGRGANPTFIKEDPSKGSYPQPALKMLVNLADPAVPNSAATLTLHGVKFENWAFSLPEDDFVMENVTFKALFLEVDDALATGAGQKADTGKPNTPFKTS